MKLRNTAIAMAVAWGVLSSIGSASAAQTVPSGLHVTREWTRSFQVRWDTDTSKIYTIQVFDSTGVIVRSFVSAHDYANVGGLRPGSKYIIRVGLKVSGSRTVSAIAWTRPVKSIGQQIASYARRFPSHARYRSGGTGPNAFDCSGLVQYVYRHFGRYIPRTAESQYRYFHRESRYQARPGDLVFFGKPDVYHVGIFEGGSTMVAAATPIEGIRYQKIYSNDAGFGTITH